MQNIGINRRSILALIGSALVPIEAAAAQYPSRPIRIIVPFGPGGSGDITARLIGKQIEEKTKQAVVIDNRPGANGIIGTMAVKSAEPDGYTVLLITTSTHAANVSLVRNLAYDPAKDFTIVGVFRSSGSYFMVRPQAPWRDLAGFIAAAKAAPGKLTFGHFNASSRTPPEYLSRLAGIELQAVPYRAIANAVADLISGEIHCLCMDTTASNQYLQNGQLRPLAITRLTRAPGNPRCTDGGRNLSGIPADRLSRHGRSIRHAARDRRGVERADKRSPDRARSAPSDGRVRPVLRHLRSCRLRGRSARRTRALDRIYPHCRYSAGVTLISA